MNQVTSENKCKPKPHSIMEIVGGILACVFLLFVAFAAYQMVVLQVGRAWNLYNAGNWIGAGAALMIAIIVINGVTSWFRK
ncbi:MAG TPA: hypothetical protein VGP79_10945 [Bryobacteraceae bacterium]|jgi:uncharacterized membrane protein YcjF (UPF0283 family)|nr:hypothetical protein [Bryobacteraceae bacterium]